MSSIDEPVHIVEYNETWPLDFAAEAERLHRGMDVPMRCIQHIGSTAVLELASKPVIDIMLGVDVFPPPEPFTRAIARLGYEPLGEADVPERLYFRRRASQNTNIHVVQRGGEHWVRNLALREYLRLHADARARYAEIKRSVLASGANSLLAYSEAKAQTVSELMSKALALKHAGEPTRAVRQHPSRARMRERGKRR